MAAAFPPEKPYRCPLVGYEVVSYVHHALNARVVEVNEATGMVKVARFGRVEWMRLSHFQKLYEDA